MTTVKKKCKRILPIVLSLLILTGCSSENNGFDIAVDMLDEKDRKSVFCEILYADDASPALVEQAKVLAAEVEEQTEMDTLVHSKLTKYSQGVIYIVLGRTSDGYTEYWFDGLRSNDYLCRLSDNVVALGGVSDEATVRAIEAFRNDVLPTAEYGWFGDDGTLFSYEGEYELDGVLLNGYAWSDYTLLASDTKLLDAAADLRKRVADKSGEYPRIRTAQKASDAKEIIISVNGGMDMPTVDIWAEGGDIYVQSDSAYGIYEGLDRLYERIVGSVVENTACVEISDRLVYKYFDGRISVSCLWSVNDTALETEASEILRSISTDVIIVWLNDENDWGYAIRGVGNGYASDVYYAADGTGVAIIFKESTVRISDVTASELDCGNVAEFCTRTVSGERNYSFVCAWGEVDADAIAAKLANIEGNAVVMVSDSVGITSEGYRTDVDASEYGVRILSNNDTEQCGREFSVKDECAVAVVSLKNRHQRAIS